MTIEMAILMEDVDPAPKLPVGNAAPIALPRSAIRERYVYSDSIISETKDHNFHQQ